LTVRDIGRLLRLDRLRSAYRIACSRPAAEATASQLRFDQEEFLYFRGTLWVTCWAWHPAGVVEVALTHPDGRVEPVRATRVHSPDLVTSFGSGAESSRFRFTHPVPDAPSAKALQLTFVLATGERITISDAAVRHLASDPVLLATSRFQQMVHAQGSGRVLELGSRAHSGKGYRDWFPEPFEYVGFDFHAGSNVDVVGDAHELSKHFPPQSFDAVFSIAVFEHLAMPWRVVLEVNKVLRMHGLVFVSTPQTWPIHEVPCDFWRFSRYGWPTLFNKFTGYEIVATEMGEPASVVGKQLHAANAGLEDHPAFLSTCVTARKIADTTLDWDVSPDMIVDTSYPRG
jgi:hypothetical protein